MKRYDIAEDGLWECDDGEFVTYEDVQAAIAEVVQAETERLRAIGDALSACIGTQEGCVLGAMIAEGVTQLESHIKAAIRSTKP
jgi:hypothetical protein